ncbi:hypothetical protein INR49_013211 [Caranx melampygus]|nr:hypothetical protein INR49_013211 [Caranx melampygus]
MTFSFSSILLPVSSARVLHCRVGRVDVGAELQRRSQFKVHGADQVILSEKQQSLAVDFLGAKLFSYVLTTCREQEAGVGGAEGGWLGPLTAAGRMGEGRGGGGGGQLLLLEVVVVVEEVEVVVVVVVVSCEGSSTCGGLITEYV